LALASGLLLLAAAIGAVGCSALQQALRPGNAQSCGNACASMVCPGGFHCTVDNQCVPRCDPEAIRPGAF
jgi:hypothetical protein